MIQFVKDAQFRFKAMAYKNPVVAAAWVSFGSMSVINMFYFTSLGSGLFTNWVVYASSNRSNERIDGTSSLSIQKGYIIYSI